MGELLIRICYLEKFAVLRQIGCQGRHLITQCDLDRVVRLVIGTFNLRSPDRDAELLRNGIVVVVCSGGYDVRVITSVEIKRANAVYCIDIGSKVQVVGTSTCRSVMKREALAVV